MKGIYVINYIYFSCIKFSFYFFKNINITVKFYKYIYYMTNFRKEMKSDFDFYFKF